MKKNSGMDIWCPGFIFAHRPQQIRGKKVPPPVGHYLEHGQPKITEQLLGDILQREAKTGEKHLLVKANVPEARLRDSTRVCAGKVKMYRRGIVEVVPEERLVRRHVDGSEPTNILQVGEGSWNLVRSWIQGTWRISKNVQFASHWKLL
jgi:hypothetical protein